MSDSEESVSRDRSPLKRVSIWVLLHVDRWLLVGAILFIIFILLALLSEAGLTPLRSIVENKNGIRYLFTAFIGTIVTGTAIVVTINQLVLAQELGPFGDQRERMEGSMAFRTDIESAADIDASSTAPSVFLSELAGALEERARALQQAVGTADDDAKGAIDNYVDSLTAETQQLRQSLSSSEFGTFDVVWSSLKFNYSRYIYTGRRIEAEFGDSLDDEARETLEETIQLLVFLGPVREHFKTLYFQWELINLSRSMLYIAVSALTVVGALLMYVDETTFHGTNFGIENLVWLTSAGFVVGISPFVVFIVYILRITTVAKLTLAIGPFILQADKRGPDE